MLTIYADPISINSRKVLAGLKLLEMPYELKRLSFFAAEHKEEDFLKINPNGAVPAAVDGDMVLWESNAILQYAADKSGKEEFYPTDLQQRADINRWMFWEAASWFASCYVYMVENCAKPLMGQEADAAVLDAENERFQMLAKILDDRLAQSEWLCAEHVTIADIAVASPMHMYGEAKLPLSDHKNLMRWMTGNIEALPCWQSTHVGPGFTLNESDT